MNGQKIVIGLFALNPQIIRLLSAVQDIRNYYTHHISHLVGNFRYYFTHENIDSFVSSYYLTYITYPFTLTHTHTHLNTKICVDCVFSNFFCNIDMFGNKQEYYNVIEKMQTEIFTHTKNQRKNCIFLFS